MRGVFEDYEVYAVYERAVTMLCLLRGPYLPFHLAELCFSTVPVLSSSESMRDVRVFTFLHERLDGWRL